MKKILVFLVLIALVVVGATAKGATETATSEQVTFIPGEKPANYPTRSIELIVPAAAGAAIDVPARAFLEYLDLGQPVVILNRAGASQTIGTAEAAAKKPDGYSMVVGANGNFMIQPHLLQLSYKTDNFRHLAMLTAPISQVLVVLPSSPYKTFTDLEKALKGGKSISYSSANPGSVGHLAAILLLEKIGGKNTKFVPFNGSPEGIAALLGGHIDFYVIDSSEVVPRMKNGQFLPLLNLADEREVTLPEVPAAPEFGYTGMIFQGYKWLAIPKDTPEQIVQYIKKQIDTALLTDGYQAFLKKLTGVGVRLYSEEEMNSIVYSNLEVAGKLLESLGMKK